MRPSFRWGKKHWLWRAVDQDGFFLEVLVQSRRNANAAKRLMHKLLKRQERAPRVMITDKLRSYDAAKREIMPGVEHRSDKSLNNRAENSHQPARRRACSIPFKSLDLSHATTVRCSTCRITAPLAGDRFSRMWSKAGKLNASFAGSTSLP